MKNFTFTLTREATESVRVIRTAPTIEEAHLLALTNPPFSGWRVDDNVPQDPYIPDPDDYRVLEYARDVDGVTHITLGSDGKWQFTDCQGYCEEFVNLAKGLSAFSHMNLRYIP